MTAVRIRLFGLMMILALPVAFSLAQPDGGGYIVVVKEGLSIGVLNKALGTRTAKQVPNTPIYLLQADGDENAVLAKLKSDARIVMAEKNRHVKLAADGNSLSSPVVEQMASLPDGHTLTTFYGTVVLESYVNQPAVNITRLSQARHLGSGAAARVGYIDTGVDFYHPALRPWLDPGVDLVYGRTASELDGLDQMMATLLDQQMATLLDKRFLFVLNQAMASLLDGGNGGDVFPPQLGHGTLVAGIIHLFAPAARIVPIKAFDANGNTTMYTIIEAVYRARDLDVDVLNMSFSVGDDSVVFRKAVAEAQARGIVVVASVGNDAIEATNLYPAAFPQVVGVSATDFNDRLASFSNYGKSVSVTAPGAYVVSTAPGGRYAAAWGTSFSAPIVSGTIALLASGRGHGQADSAAALTTADSIDALNPGFERKLGKGRVNVLRALTSRK